MKLSPHLLAAALALLASGSALAEVSVSYIKPEEFSDMPFSPRDREQLLKELSAHFAHMGQQLPAGQVLKIEVLDVDLAGRLYPRYSGPEDLRVLRGGADWPHMRLHFTLEQDGKLLRSGEAQLSNMMYQERMNRYSGTDSLRYEKQMLDDWFAQEFLRTKGHS
ncbi:MAG: DUF3016 domain-containing protein [Sphingomonadaceae bacterium]